MSIAAPATRILDAKLERKIMSAETAASLIPSGDQIGMSGFTGSGYPKAVPLQLARRIADAHFLGEKFQVSVFTGASTGPELDGALAMARDSAAATVSVRSGDAETDQRGRDGLDGHSSEPCGAVCRVRISGQAGCGAD